MLPVRGRLDRLPLLRRLASVCGLHLARDRLVHRRNGVDLLEQLLSAFLVQLRAIVVGHCHKPGVRVHRYQGNPVLSLHAVSCKVDPENWLGKLGGNLLLRKVDLPLAVRLACERSPGAGDRENASEKRQEHDGRVGARSIMRLTVQTQIFSVRVAQ